LQQAVGKVEAFHVKRSAQGSFKGPDHRIVNFGGSQMSYRHRAIAAAALSFAVLASTGFAGAADLPAKAAKAPADLPFFLVVDNR
jgi:hypothetical protein